LEGSYGWKLIIQRNSDRRFGLMGELEETVFRRGYAAVPIKKNWKVPWCIFQVIILLGWGDTPLERNELFGELEIPKVFMRFTLGLGRRGLGM